MLAIQGLQFFVIFAPVDLCISNIFLVSALTILYANIGVKNVNFVKVDVEGSELETLIGMRSSLQKFRPNILCEVLFTNKDGDLLAHKLRNQQLMELLSQLEFCVFQLIKTENSPQVIDVKRIQEFSSAYWTLENADLCDYLFIPKERERQVLGSLFPSRAIATV
jgi:hypothetical protein